MCTNRKKSLSSTEGFSPVSCQEDLDESAPLDPRYVRVWNHTEAPLEVLAFPKDMVLGWWWRGFFRVREKMLGGRFQFFLGVCCYVSFGSLNEEWKIEIEMNIAEYYCC